MERWVTIERIYELSLAYKSVCAELGEMQRVWERTNDIMCSPSQQLNLKHTLHTLCIEIKELSKML